MDDAKTCGGRPGAAAWRAVKPSDDGAVTSIEPLDAGGEAVAPLFGARKPDRRGREDWRAIAAEVSGTCPLAPCATLEEGAA